jgi:hypoxanthine-DNA glycosylase
MIEHHPYGEFIPRHPRCMIIGSFPIAKFTHPQRRQEIKDHEYDFFFGGETNLLWKLLAATFKEQISSKYEIIELLEKKGIAMGDVIKACKRRDGSAADAALYDIKWNHQLLEIIHSHNIKMVFFTSRKVETWFNKLFPESKDLLKICLISPSAQSYRAIGATAAYKQWKQRHPGQKMFDYVLNHYKKAFKLLEK